MHIAIIGTGNVGAALATQWAKAGHHIYLGVRDTTNFKGIHLLANSNTTVHSISEACAQAEAILVATPPQYAETLSEQMGDLNSKVLIDATNAIRTQPEHYPTAYHAFAALTEAAVVKCFNTTGYENMLDPKYGATSVDLFMAGDSEMAKEMAKQLALDAGFAECYNFGGSQQVQLLEQFALAWINLAIFQGMGRGIGLKVLKR